jgi:peptide/nickel transport system permease protein
VSGFVTGVEEITAAAGPAGLTGSPTERSRSYWRESADRLWVNRIAVACAAYVLLLAAAALLAPLFSRYVTHYDATTQDLTQLFRSPSGRHLLGTDELGRDTLTRLIYGAQVSLAVGFLTATLSLVVGGTVGMVSGYLGGWVDSLLMRLVDIILSIPAIFLYILLSTLLRPNAVTLSFIIAFVGWGNVCRLVRAEALSLRSREFIVATRSIGAGTVRVIVRHLLPNALPVMIVAASLAVGQIILAESALSFLGLGIQPPTPSWGNMLSNAQQYYYHSVWLVLFPGLMIVLVVLAASLLGNAVRDAFDPRLR